MTLGSLRILLAGTSLALTASLLACGDDKPEAKPDSSDNTSAETAKDGTPTWYQDIQPIVHLKCGACHQPDAIAPFSVMAYESAKNFAPLMADAVEQGRMPPFSARVTDECKPRNKYANDPRLTDDEKKLLRAWADGGAPAGDPKTAAEVKDPAPVTIARADVVMKLPEPIVVEDKGKGDLHTCLV